MLLTNTSAVSNVANTATEPNIDDLPSGQEAIVINPTIQGHLTMESFQMRPKCLKSSILCLESLFS